MTLIALLAAVTTPAAGKAMVAAYDELCVQGASSPEAVLSRADQDGWQKNGSGALDRFKTSGATRLKLIVRESKAGGERFETCGISVASPQPDLPGDVQAMLGFAPAFHLGQSATFYAVRDHDRWTDASKLSRSDFGAAKAAGKFFSVMALSAGTGSSLFSLQTLPPSP